MAEAFTNFLGIVKTGSEKIVIPAATTNNNTSPVGDTTNTGVNKRTLDSIVIVNGLYVSSTTTGTAYNISIFIKDNNYQSRPIYIVNNIPIPEHTGFFLERAITLTPSQSLVVSMPKELNPTNGVLHVSASSIEVTK